MTGYYVLEKTDGKAALRSLQKDDEWSPVTHSEAAPTAQNNKTVTLKTKDKNNFSSIKNIQYF